MANHFFYKKNANMFSKLTENAYLCIPKEIINQINVLSYAKRKEEKKTQDVYSQA